RGRAALSRPEATAARGDAGAFACAAPPIGGKTPPGKRDMIHDFAGALSAIFTGERARLLHVIVPAHVHGHTLALLRALGEAGPSPRPVWILADPTYGPSRGWAARARSLARELGDPPAG